MKRKITIFGLAFALSVSLSATFAVARISKEVARAQDFRPYLGEESILPNFDGSNVKLLRDYLVRASDGAAKREFETTSEYESRIGNLAVMLNPIDVSKPYAVPIDGVTAKYDADREEWTFSTFSGCREYPGHASLWECLSLSERILESEYIGQNAYGATAKVQNVTYNDIRFVLSTSFPGVRQAFREGGLNEYALNLKIDMPIGDAKRYAGATFNVYAVGYLVGPWVRIAKPITISPTISDPQRTRMNSVTLPLLAQHLVVVAKGRPGAVAVYSLTGKALVPPS